MTVNEAAVEVGVSVHTLYSYLKSGVIGEKPEDARTWDITKTHLKALIKHKNSIKKGRPAKAVDKMVEAGGL